MTETPVMTFLNQCQKNLIDTSARNNLVNFRFNAATCFDIEKFSQVRKKQRSQEGSFEIEKIDNYNSAEELDEKEKLQREAHKILGKTYLKQQEIRDEKGFNPTSWAYCFFKYKDGEKERFAPVFLISTEVSKNGKGGYCVNHFSDGMLEVSFNHAIYEKFKSDFKVNLDKNLIDFDDSEIFLKDVDQKLCKIQEFLVGNIHGIVIEKRVVIGIFNSAKASLYNELIEFEKEFLNHKLVKIFLSNQSDELNQGELSEDAREIDKIPSDKFFSLFDFDSSQLQAIKAAKDGKNFVIQGPPGTGKTQTISNVISELVAQGKKVLFVAEKKAAIDAVLKNFSKIGLEKIFLDLHDKKSKSKDIVSQVIDSIEFFRYENSTSHSSTNLLSKLDQAKKDLSKRSELLHQKLSFGKKPFDLIFELSEMENIEDVDGSFSLYLSEEDFNRCLNTLDQLNDLSDIYLDSQNPFLSKDLSKKDFLLSNFFKENLIKIINLFEQIERNNDSIRELSSITIPKIKFLTILKNKLDKRRLKLAQNLAWSNLSHLLQINGYLNKDKKITKEDFLRIKELVIQENLYKNFIEKTFNYLEIKESLKEYSIYDFWNNALKNKISARDIKKAFKKSFYSYVLKNLINKNELISDTKTTSQIINDFKFFDKSSIEINKKRIIESIKNHSSKIIRDYEFRELKYRQRFSKPRKIISKYRDIIVNSVGCVVCSPLTICEYFEVDKSSYQNPIFDVVIFDEASQIFTWDALSSIFRASQMIIAGDTQQMPPTNLFATNDNDEDFDEGDEDIGNVNDYKSLLSYAAMRLKEIQLQWHYRSKFEQLIHPSNQFVYNGRLISFPNSDKNEKPIIFHYLPKGMWVEQTNDVEAKYLINLLKEIHQTGVKSVGVIAINKKQQTLIRDLIYSDEELTAWLDSDDEDGLFVKNLENCQGDERDIVIVCSSYAKNKDGRILGTMFRQINAENSYKRLNVMFSRAKKKLHFLSSLKWQDISLQYEGRKGMDFFKSYLRFAETGDFGIISKNHVKQDSFDSGFEESVCKSLRLLGYEVDSQVGCSGYKIDLAVICPNTKNYILGIECDGEMYHSGKTARERDRLRQEVLESKGWNIHRIWSYDWIHCKKDELEKLKTKINQHLH